MTLSALGIFSAAGAGGVVAGDFELISSSILGSNTSEISFDVSSLGSTYKHLQIRAVARSTHSAGSEYANITLNGATSYWQHGLEGNGSTLTSYGGSVSSMAIVQMARSNDNTNSFGAGVIDILEPFSTTKNKTIRGFGGVYGTASTNTAIRSGSWASTSAVTTIVVKPFSAANWVTGSRFSLYGIKG